MSLKHSILALLSKGPKTGYELSKDAEGSIGFFWNATHQQIYKDLAELKKKGWAAYREVEQAEKPDKKIYSITKPGLSELKRWLSEKAESPPSRDALLIKLFVGHLAKPKILLEDLLAHKGEHLARKRSYQEIEQRYFRNIQSAPRDRQFQYLTLKRGIGFETEWLKWCDDVEVFLKSLFHR